FDSEPLPQMCHQKLGIFFSVPISIHLQKHFLKHFLSIVRKKVLFSFHFWWDELICTYPVLFFQYHIICKNTNRILHTSHFPQNMVSISIMKWQNQTLQ